ncbi:MAG TPA: hypothetical protein VLC46_01750 [Thermoanaerobaculia bacterium]|jgi:hypothetical protein|nr:hypothetical protein [Thermoanaerobaculia bacterium]
MPGEEPNNASLGHSETLTKALVQPSAAEGAAVKRAVVRNCLVAAFVAELHQTIGETDTIVWTTLDDRVILKIGDAVTDCIRAKGFGCPLLAPSFQALKDNNLVSLVSSLIDAIVQVVTP